MSAVLDDPVVVRCQGGPWDGQSTFSDVLLHSEVQGFRYEPTPDDGIWKAVQVPQLCDHPPKPTPLPLTREEDSARQKMYYRLLSEFEWSANERDPLGLGRAEFSRFHGRATKHDQMERRILHAVLGYESLAFIGARQLQWLLLQIQTQG